MAAIACLLFAIVLVTSLLWSPITPDKSRATSTGHDTTTSQQISFAHGTARERVTADGRTNAQRNEGQRRGGLLQWLPATVLLLTFTATLLVNGLVHGHHSADTIADPQVTDNSAVPQRVQQPDRPIIDTTHARPATIKVPRKAIVLTFDDGPDTTWTPKVLHVLRKHHVPATFFVVGSSVVRHPGLVGAIHRSGSELGVHTFTHANMTQVPDWQRQKELTETQLGLVGAAGVTRSIVRPPYSSSTDAVDNANWRMIKGPGRQGYHTALTSLDSDDWTKPGAAKIVQNSTPKNGKGEVLLMHDAGGDRSETRSRTGIGGSGGRPARTGCDGRLR